MDTHNSSRLQPDPRWQRALVEKHHALLGDRIANDGHDARVGLVGHDAGFDAVKGVAEELSLLSARKFFSERCRVSEADSRGRRAGSHQKGGERGDVRWPV